MSANHDHYIEVIELSSFQRQSQTIFSEEALQKLIYHLALNPEAGDIVPGTGGVRKIRWAIDGGGKRSGARVIYFYHSALMPLFLLTAYAKGEKANLTMRERNLMQRLVQDLVKEYRTSE